MQDDQALYEQFVAVLAEMVAEYLQGTENTERPL